MFSAGLSAGALAFALLACVAAWRLVSFGTGAAQPEDVAARAATTSLPATPHVPSAGWTNPRRGRLAGPYPAQVLHVIDGDTFVARIPIWLGQDVVTHVRLRGIDAPERGGRCPGERHLADEARNALRDVLASGRIALRDIGAGRYAGRVIARAYVTGFLDNVTADAGEMLVAAGYARRYRGGRRGDWCF